MAEFGPELHWLAEFGPELHGLAGCGADFTLEHLDALAAAVPTLDAILLSHPDINHLGALPRVVAKMGLPVTSEYRREHSASTAASRRELSDESCWLMRAVLVVDVLVKSVG